MKYLSVIACLTLAFAVMTNVPQSLNGLLSYYDCCDSSVYTFDPMDKYPEDPYGNE